MNKMNIHGKHVGGHIYWHYLLTTNQPKSVQDEIRAAELCAGIKAGGDYNIVKYPRESGGISLLCYPDFFEEPFPALSCSWLVDNANASVKRRNYADSLNPPILHRKELFIPDDHPLRGEYLGLTESAEQLGFFENSRSIGFRLAWESLIRERGYRLVGHKLLPVGNDETVESIYVNTDIQSATSVQRHRTALSRDNFSAPMQALARFNFLDGTRSVFDYGCGKGDDVRNLIVNNIVASGWDPHFCPNEERKSAEIVNLGFVINVIENLEERLEALRSAFALARELLVVSAMLYNQNAFKGQQYKDGVLTSRETFQKYFTQVELKEFIDDTLSVDSIPVGPGIFFVFCNGEAEQLFLMSRQRSRSNLLRLTKREAPTPRISVRDLKHQANLKAIEPLRDLWFSLGREPTKKEVLDLVELHQIFGTLGKALRFLVTETDPTLFEKARTNRINDLLVYFALHAFSQRRAYKHVDPILQVDIKTFFGTYSDAIELGRSLLFRLSDVTSIETACKIAAEDGIGFYDEEGALYLPSAQVDRLPPLLRVYIGCAAKLYGDISNADLVKIHTSSGKLSLMRYDNFYGSPIPKLLERVKIKFRSLDFDLYSYGEVYEPTYLYRKSRYLNEDSPGYSEQLEFDEKLEMLGIFDFSKYGPRPQKFRDELSAARWEIEGMCLIRNTSVPQLDEQCGQYLLYRNLIECGETWDRLKVENIPQQADTYNALYDLAKNVLDPVIEYFGMIQLTYCFSSSRLAKNITGRIAPKLDQHASCELSRDRKPICSRLGAAVDFFVEDEDMFEVAKWVAENTPFDRIYYYGSDRPIHVSYGPENKREFIEMRVCTSGRLVPYVRRDLIFSHRGVS